MVVSTTDLRPLLGRVVSAQGVSVAAAEVRCSGIAVPAQTGNDGRFTFAAVPRSMIDGTNAPAKFEVIARGKSYQVAASPDPSSDNTVLLIIDPIGVMP
jgi:hypothetical protein